MGESSPSFQTRRIKISSAHALGLHCLASRNGKTPGIVQPSVKGQEAVIRTAYRRAGLPVTETDYVEVRTKSKQSQASYKNFAISDPNLLLITYRRMVQVRR